jgi:hypothetical protein
MMEILAGSNVHPRPRINGLMFNVRSGQERLKRMNRRQAAVFARAGGKYALDFYGVSIKKGQDPVLKYVNPIHRVYGGIHLRKA